MLAQHKDSPVYKVQPTTKSGEKGIHTLYRNMLFPLQSVRDEETTGQNDALVRADLAMMKYFS